MGVRGRLDERQLELHVSGTAVDWLARAGYDPAYGARPVGRAVRQHLLNPLARELIGHNGSTDGLHVVVDATGVAADALRIRLLADAELEGALAQDEWAI